MKTLLTVAALGFCAACGISTPPPPPPAPRDPLPIRASVARAWNAAIDEFAASNIPIKNIDRASGFISTDPMGVTEASAIDFADCGTVFGSGLKTDRGTYNVIVRGDSAGATVLATVRFTYGGRPSMGANDPYVKDCSSTGRWEQGFETRVKARAEAKPPV